MPASASDADAPRYLEPLRLDNYYWSRRHHSRDDLRLTDAAVAIEELTAYRDAGGGTIVDVTSVGLGRDPTALAKISRATGVHIVMGCGYYYVDYHPRELAAADPRGSRISAFAVTMATNLSCPFLPWGAVIEIVRSDMGPRGGKACSLRKLSTNCGVAKCLGAAGPKRRERPRNITGAGACF